MPAGVDNGSWAAKQARSISHLRMMHVIVWEEADKKRQHLLQMEALRSNSRFDQDPTTK